MTILADQLRGLSNKSNRKLFLFAYACLNEVKDLITDSTALDALKLLEQFPEGDCSKAQLFVMEHFIWDIYNQEQILAKREAYSALGLMIFGDYCAVPSVVAVALCFKNNIVGKAMLDHFDQTEARQRKYMQDIFPEAKS